MSTTSMLMMTGQLINVFEAPKGINTKTGDEYGGKPRIQLLGALLLPNGETRYDLVTLGVEDDRPYNAIKGSQISVPVSVFVSGRNAVYFVPKGSRPQVLTGAAA
jgi:hypothetical protein